MDCFYDVFIRQIKKVIKKISPKELEGDRGFIVIAVSEERIMDLFVKNVTEITSGKSPDVVFVAQPRMIPILKNMKGIKADTWEWSGRYDSDTADYILSKSVKKDFESLLFFCDQPVNYRNRNILEIADKIRDQKGVRILTMDSEGDFYEYMNIKRTLKGMKIYEDMNDFIGMSCI